MRIRSRRFHSDTVIRIRIQPFTLMRVRILLIIKEMQICDQICDGDHCGSGSPTQPSTPYLHRVTKRPSIPVLSSWVVKKRKLQYFWNCYRYQFRYLRLRLVLEDTGKQKLHMSLTVPYFRRSFAWTQSNKLINWLIIWLMDSCKVTRSKKFLDWGKVWLIRYRTCLAYHWCCTVSVPTYRSFINILVN